MGHDLAGGYGIALSQQLSGVTNGRTDTPGRAAQVNGEARPKLYIQLTENTAANHGK